MRAAYRAAGHEMLAAAVDRLARLVDEAADTLERAMSCGRPDVEVRAAVAVVARAYRAEAPIRHLHGRR